MCYLTHINTYTKQREIECSVNSFKTFFNHQNDEIAKNAECFVDENILSIINISNLRIAREDKVNMDINTFKKLIKSIQTSIEQYNISQSTIHSLQNKVKYLETNIKNIEIAVCFHLSVILSIDIYSDIIIII